MKGLFAYNLYIKPKLLKLPQFSTSAQYFKKIKININTKRKTFLKPKKKKKKKT